MFLAALFTVAKIWKQPKCPWMDLEGITLSEISQTERQILNTVWYHLYVESKKARIIETQSGVVVTRSWVLGKWGDIGPKYKLPVIR